MISRKSVVAVYVRHSRGCQHADKGELFRGCDCPKWLRYSSAGKQHRQAANTRAWGAAEGARENLQKRLDGAPSGGTGQGEQTEQTTITHAVELYVSGKKSQGFGATTVRKARQQLTQFADFMAKRSKQFPRDITSADLIEYRAVWTHAWKSGLTRQKASTRLRSLLTFMDRGDLLPALETIKLSREDSQRLKPRPFSEDEIKRLLAQVPKTFPDATRAARLTALIHLCVGTGLALRDAVQLERSAIVDGWLKIDRQKTGKTVNQKLNAGLARELQAVANGNPKYFFWSGKSAQDSMTQNWSGDLRQLMQDAGVWIKGNLSHRFRDTAVDFWLGEGCDMTTVAAMLGDSVAVTEKHYADLASARMRERLAKVPTRTW